MNIQWGDVPALLLVIVIILTATIRSKESPAANALTSMIALALWIGALALGGMFA